LIGEPEGKRSLKRRNMCSFEDDIEMMLKKLYGMGWCILDTFIWLEVESSGVSCEHGNELEEFGPTALFREIERLRGL
jgi:hypothetical protein